jgi:hypothetical protein
MAKKHKTTNIGCGFLLPRTTVWVLLSILILMVNFILCILGFTELIDPIQWRWGMCGYALALSGIYILLLIYNTRIIRKKLQSKRKERQSYGDSLFYSYEKSLELKHAWTGILFFLAMSIFWAVFMGIKVDGDFLITTNLINYITLKLFYLFDVIVTIGLIAASTFNFFDDVVDHRLKILEGTA